MNLCHGKGLWQLPLLSFLFSKYKKKKMSEPLKSEWSHETEHSFNDKDQHQKNV